MLCCVLIMKRIAGGPGSTRSTECGPHVCPRRKTTPPPAPLPINEKKKPRMDISKGSVVKRTCCMLALSFCPGVVLIRHSCSVAAVERALQQVGFLLRHAKQRRNHGSGGDVIFYLYSVSRHKNSNMGEEGGDVSGYNRMHVGHRESVRRGGGHQQSSPALAGTRYPRP